MNNLPESEKGPQGLKFDRLLLERYMPAGMIERKQWAVAGASKAPQSPNDKGKLRNISVNEPNDWLTFDEAAAICEANRETVTYATKKDGTVFTQFGYNVGFILHKEDEYAVIDTDVKDATTHPHNPELWTTDEQRERYAELVEDFDSYTEWSRSGKGLHILVKGKLPNDGEGKNRDGVEVYSQQRFLICTGNVFRDKPVEWRQELLTGLVKQLLANTHSDLPPLESQPEKASDEAVIERARLASNAEKFNPLWAGKWVGAYPSQSEADMALMGILAFYSPNNEQCIRLFRASGLGQREKAKRADYVNRTIKAARAKQAHEQAAMAQVDITGLLANFERRAPETQVSPHIAGPATEPPTLPATVDTSWHVPRILFDDDLSKMPQLEWFVKGIIPTKGIGCIYGASGSYKSFLTLDLLAHIANGREWFGKRVRPAHTVYIPFEGQGGVPNRIRAWRLAQTRLADADSLHIADPSPTIKSMIGFIFDHINLQEPSGRSALIDRLKANHFKNGVICIDTLAHAANGLDENSSEMSRILGYFKEIQIALDCLIIIIHHAGKDGSRGMRGWSGLHAAMDFVIECSRKEVTTASKERTAIFRIAKSKDSVDGAFFKFAAEPIGLGLDDDGDSISSLVIKPLTDEDEASADEDHSATDEFVLERVKAELSEARLPTGRSLEKQISSWDKKITQRGLRESVKRLKECGKLRTSTDKAENGKAYLILGG